MGGEKKKRNFEAVEGTTLVNYSEITAAFRKLKESDAVMKLTVLCMQPKGSAFHQLQQFRKLVPELINAYTALWETQDALLEEFDRMCAKTQANKNKRWTKEQEECLVELVCRGNLSPVEISATMGRSVTAISTKVSDLVGVSRISQNVAGQFFGKINGEQTSGIIEGVVQKDRRKKKATTGAATPTAAKEE